MNTYPLTSPQRRVASFLTVATLASLIAGIPAVATGQELVADAAPALPGDSAQRISGVVQDPRGLPLLGAFVAAIALGADQPAAIVVTDARGRFELDRLPQGLYSLLVGSLGFTGTVIQGVNVPAIEPITLQLQPDGDRDLSLFDAPLDLSWALRSKKRDVLRQGEATLVTDGGDVVSTAWTPSAAPAAVGAPEAVVGELRVWSFTNLSDRETVGITSLSLNSGDSWNVRAHVGDTGNLWAAGDVNREFSNNHDVRVGFGYVGGDTLLDQRPGRDAREGWTGKVDAQDRWSLASDFSVTYGLAYEHHNYLADSGLMSPRFELSYSVGEGTRVTTGLRHTARGLGLLDPDGFESLSLLNNSRLRLGDTTTVRAERSTRYHVGLEQQIGAAEVRVKAYYDDVTDELLGVYVAGENGLGNYLLFNVGDAASHGVEVGVAAELFESVSGELSYAYRDRDTAYSVNATSLGGVDDLPIDQTHEVRAAVSAELPASHTFLLATYNWRQGIPVVQDGELRSDFGRLDLRVRQPLPFRALQTEWSAMVQIRNVLGPQYDELFNVSLAELVGLTRGIAGGLAVRF